MTLAAVPCVWLSRFRRIGPHLATAASKARKWFFNSDEGPIMEYERNELFVQNDGYPWWE